MFTYGWEGARIAGSIGLGFAAESGCARLGGVQVSGFDGE